MLFYFYKLHKNRQAYLCTDFKDFMNDEDMKKDKAILKPQKGEAGKLIYQVKFIMRYLSYTFMEILFFYTSMM